MIKMKKNIEKNLVSVVFPTMNRKEHLIKCIDSLLNGKHKKIEIIISDNGSTDNSVDTIRKMFPEVIIFESDLNLGYAISVNNCIEKSKGEFILRLDDDMILEKETISNLLEIITNDSKIGAVSCVNFFTERPEILRSTGMTINMFTGNTYIYDRGRKYFGEYEKKLIEREIVPGGSMLVRRKVLEEVGMCSEEYFLTYEDVDLSLKIRDAGYKIFVVGSAKIYHANEGLSQINNNFRIYLKERGRVLLVKKFGKWKRAFFFPYLFMGIIPVKIIINIKERNFKAIRALIKGVYDAIFNVRIFVYNKDYKQIPYLLLNKDKIFK